MLALVCGCADKRISVEKLTRLEAEGTQVEPVDLETAALALIATTQALLGA